MPLPAIRQVSFQRCLFPAPAARAPETQTLPRLEHDFHDAPALAQANVSVAMNSGTQAANLVDLDFDPTKLIDQLMRSLDQTDIHMIATGKEVGK